VAVECFVLVDGNPDPARFWFVSTPRIGEGMRLPNCNSTSVVRAITHVPCADGVTNAPPEIQIHVEPQAEAGDF